MSKEKEIKHASRTSARLDWHSYVDKLINDILYFKISKKFIRPRLSKDSGIHQIRIVQIVTRKVNPSLDDFIRLRFALNDVCQREGVQFKSENELNAQLSDWVRAYIKHNHNARLQVRKRKTST